MAYLLRLKVARHCGSIFWFELTTADYKQKQKMLACSET